jgi:hypothetical protein
VCRESLPRGDDDIQTHLIQINSSAQSAGTVVKICLNTVAANGFIISGAVGGLLSCKPWMVL